MPIAMVLNAGMLRTFRYIDAAASRLGVEGHQIHEQDGARLPCSEIGASTYRGTTGLTVSVPREGRRSLHGTDTVGLDQDGGDTK
ncbi:hypothetical protein [Peterkaempfera sp. SMS 1(5)a]|uniref:hypothetical protein n=1 Tax=Peterkaempfera podocarpi TaxID=3232308 RepID=UPI00366AB25B